MNKDLLYVGIVACGFLIGFISSRNDNESKTPCKKTTYKKAELTKELQAKFNKIVKESVKTRTVYQDYTLPIEEYLLFISIYGDRDNVDPEYIVEDLMYQLRTDKNSYRYDPDYKKHYSHHKGTTYEVGNKGLTEFEEAQLELFKNDQNRQINRKKAI